MSLFEFIAENFIIVAGSIGLVVTSLWSKIQPFLAKLFAPSPFQQFPLPMPRTRVVVQPDDDETDDAEETMLAVTSISYVIDYFMLTKNAKGEAFARSAAKAIFEAQPADASKQ